MSVPNNGTPPVAGGETSSDLMVLLVPVVASLFLSLLNLITSVYNNPRFKRSACCGAEVEYETQIIKRAVSETLKQSGELKK